MDAAELPLRQHLALTLAQLLYINSPRVRAISCTACSVPSEIPVGQGQGQGV